MGFCCIESQYASLHTHAIARHLPEYAPPNPIWGKPQDDGQSLTLVWYLALSEVHRPSAPLQIIMIMLKASRAFACECVGSARVSVGSESVDRCVPHSIHHHTHSLFRVSVVVGASRRAGRRSKARPPLASCSNGSSRTTIPS